LVKGGIFLKGKEEKRQEISYGEAEVMAIFLDKMMRGDNFSPDFIIGISRGSYHLVAMINSMTLKWAKIGYFDIDIDKLCSDRKVIKSSSFTEEKNLKGVRVLICEDDLRSGSSFMAAREYLERKGADVRTMSFFSHPFSRVTPDYIFQKNIDYEVSFPWDKLKQYAKTKSP